MLLKPFQKRSTPAFADLLPYAVQVEDGIIMGKDGSLIASWFYRGTDEQSLTAGDKESRNDRLNQALRKLGSGWCTHHNAIRIEARKYCDPDQNHFPDPVTLAIERERAEYFQRSGTAYETIYTLTVCYMPPLAYQSKVASMMFEDEDGEGPREILGDKILRQFRQSVQDLEDYLKITLRVQRMKAYAKSDAYGVEHEFDDQLTFFEYCITGENVPLKIPEWGMYLDSYLGGVDFWTGIVPKIGKNFIRVVSIDGFPTGSHAGMLNTLDSFAVECRWSTRFIYLDSHEAEAHIKKYTRKWEQRKRGFFAQLIGKHAGKINQDAARMASDADEAKSEAGARNVTFGYYSSVVVLMHPDKEFLDDTARELRKEIRNLGFEARVEEVNSVEAFLGSLPGNTFANIRRPLVHTLNLVDMLPNAAIWAGRETNPCPFFPPNSPPLCYAKTSGNTPFRFNNHVSDVGHTLILGPTGAGKSTLLAFLAASMRRYQDVSIFSFDKGRSLYALTKACGGRHYHVGEDKSLTFAPLVGVDSDAEQMWAEEWIEGLMVLQNVQITPKHKQGIHEAMSKIRQSERQHRTMSDFVTNLQDAELRNAIEYYTEGGACGKLLDAHENSVASNGTFECYEIEELMHMGDQKGLPVLLFLFHQIENRLKGQPAYILLDEAWLMLSHPVFRNKIREWLKVLRKANCSVIMATQSLSDLFNSGIVDVLSESCPTKIYLPNNKVGQEQSRDYYYKMGLNDAQLELIRNAIPKREYYVSSDDGNRLVDFALGPVAIAFCAVSSKDDLAEIQNLEDIHGEAWPKAWMAKKISVV